MIGVHFYLREGEQTVDFRAIVPGAIQFTRQPPYAIMLQRVRQDGHNGSELCGTIYNAGRAPDGTIIAEGIFDTESEAGSEALRLVYERKLQTWSPDVGNPVMVPVEMVEKPTGRSTEKMATRSKKKSDYDMPPQSQPSPQSPQPAELLSGVFIGATIVPFPSMDSAVIELFDTETGEVIVPAPQRMGMTASINMEQGRCEFTFPAGGGGNGGAGTATILAHAVDQTARPPAEFFSDPGFTELQRYVTITDDGRFMTHVAAWGECHVGYGDMCVSPPEEADYSHFCVGTVLTSDGNSIPTGVIAVKGGHADLSLDAAAARSHYDDPTTAMVDVALGTDAFGIWASGAIRPTATEHDIHMLRASGVSGDWRLIDGELRLVGICSVNVPGFPKLSMAASAEEGVVALVAAGGEPQPSPQLDDCDDCADTIRAEIDALRQLVSDAGIEDAAIERLAARIPAEPTLDELYARVLD